MIIINSLGIQDSGGITVFDKLLHELENNHKYSFLIMCNKHNNILSLLKKYEHVRNFEFMILNNRGFLHRLYFENIVFKKIIKEKNISLVYNFSGSAQFFLEVPQITKVHNLLFYSKKNDQVYFEKKYYLQWFKQICSKRLIFHSMIRQSNYIEVQSDHVKTYTSDFINVSKKQFFIKSDIDTSNELFQNPKEYDFSRKIRFLYIVGPHFEYLHKNFEDFVNSMIGLKNVNFDFEIVLTLTKEQLHHSILWDKNLDKKTIFLGYVSKNELKRQFHDNTILISTSVIETLGLHVIEAIQNGILVIVPNEKYCLDVYGGGVLTYELFDTQSMVKKIKNITSLRNNEIKDIIEKNQQYLIKNENTKYQNVLDIFNEIVKEKNV